MSNALEKLLSLDMDEELEIFREMEEEYRKFRTRIGEIAVAHHRNPFLELVSFLDASLRTEKMHWEDAKKAGDEKRDRAIEIVENSDMNTLIAEALGIDIKDAKDVELTPENVNAVMQHIVKLAEKDDEELDM